MRCSKFWFALFITYLGTSNAEDEILRNVRLQAEAVKVYRILDASAEIDRVLRKMPVRVDFDQVEKSTKGYFDELDNAVKLQGKELQEQKKSLDMSQAQEQMQEKQLELCAHSEKLLQEAEDLTEIRMRVMRLQKDIGLARNDLVLREEELVKMVTSKTKSVRQWQEETEIVRTMRDDLETLEDTLLPGQEELRKAEIIRLKPAVTVKKQAEFIQQSKKNLQGQNHFISNDIVIDIRQGFDQTSAVKNQDVDDSKGEVVKQKNIEEAKQSETLVDSVAEGKKIADDKAKKRQMDLEEKKRLHEEAAKRREKDQADEKLAEEALIEDRRKNPKKYKKIDAEMKEQAKALIKERKERKKNGEKIGETNNNELNKVNKQADSERVTLAKAREKKQVKQAKIDEKEKAKKIKLEAEKIKLENKNALIGVNDGIPKTSRRVKILSTLKEFRWAIGGTVVSLLLVAAYFTFGPPAQEAEPRYIVPPIIPEETLMKEKCQEIASFAVIANGIAQEKMQSVARWKELLNSFESTYNTAYERAINHQVRNLTKPVSQDWGPSFPLPPYPSIPSNATVELETRMLAQYESDQNKWHTNEFLRPIYAQLRLAEEHRDAVHSRAFGIMINAKDLPFSAESEEFKHAYVGFRSRLEILARCYPHIKEDQFTKKQFNSSREQHAFRNLRLKVALNLNFIARSNFVATPPDPSTTPASI